MPSDIACQYPQPPPVPDLERPGLVRRAGAVLIDVLVLFEVVVVTVVVSVLTIEALGLTVDPDSALVDPVVGVVQVSIVLLLTVVIPSRRSDRGTPGSSSVHIGVVTAHGAPARSRHLLVRAVIRYLPLMVIGFPWLAYGLVDLVVAGMRSDRRTVTDVASGTEMATRSTIITRQSSDPEGS